jgi:hypothetical protein
MVGLILLGIFILLGIVATYVKGLDDMNDNHPDYKGDDLFDEEIKEWDATLMDGLADDDLKDDDLEDDE